MVTIHVVLCGKCFEVPFKKQLKLDSLESGNTIVSLLVRSE